MGSAVLGRDHVRAIQRGPTVGVSTSVRYANWYADPMRPRTFTQSGKAIIHPSSLRSDAKFAATNRFAFLPCTPKRLASFMPRASEGASSCRGACPTPCKPYVGHAVPRRWMTALPLRLRARCRSGSAYLSAQRT